MNLFCFLTGSVQSSERRLIGFGPGSPPRLGLMYTHLNNGLFVPRELPKSPEQQAKQQVSRFRTVPIRLGLNQPLQFTPTMVYRAAQESGYQPYRPRTSVYEGPLYAQITPPRPVENGRYFTAFDTSQSSAASSQSEGNYLAEHAEPPVDWAMVSQTGYSYSAPEPSSVEMVSSPVVAQSTPSSRTPSSLPLSSIPERSTDSERATALRTNTAQTQQKMKKSREELAKLRQEEERAIKARNEAQAKLKAEIEEANRRPRASTATETFRKFESDIKSIENRLEVHGKEIGALRQRIQLLQDSLQSLEKRARELTDRR